MIFINSYDIVEAEVKKYWNREYPQDVVAFFWQKYDHEKTWEWCEELIECCGSDDYENVTFVNDFCEGQTCVKGLTIVSLREVTGFFTENKGLKKSEA